ncbi:host specificity factor TipJ family phage tail protein, partial [Jiella pacifica]
MNSLVRSPIQGELLGPGETVEVVAALHPLKRERVRIRVPSGSSVAEVVEICAAEGKVSRLAVGAHVSVNGETVAQERWDGHRVVTGDVVVVRAVAGKAVGNLLRTILSIALVVFASFIVGPSVLGIAGTILGTVVSAAIVFGGNLALNSLFPATDTRAIDDRKQVYSISSRQNQAARWQPIPVVLGEHRVAAKYAASPYTEFDGDDQYLRMLFVWGHGPLELSAIKIGETPIEDFDDVEIQTFGGYPDDGQQTLYPSEVVQLDLGNLELAQEDGLVKRSSAAEASEIVVDVVWPNGLVNIDTSTGDKGKHTWRGTLTLRDDDTNAVLRTILIVESAKSYDPIRKSYRFKDLDGVRAYSVGLQKTSDDHGDDHADTAIWSALKTFRTSPPIEYGKPLAITALRIRATKQLNGVITDLTALARAKAKSWTGSAWMDDTPTRSAADLFRLVLQGPGNARPKTDAQIDLAAVERWADLCRLFGWTFDMYRDFKASVRDTLKDICAAGRAVPVFVDGKFSVAMEDSLAPIVQAFTPRNSRNFSVVYNYRELPHGLRVKFVNRDKDYVEDETLVFDDGWNKETATLFEQVEFPGVTDPDLIFRHARYRIAEAKLRSRVLRFTTDLEHLVCSRGDRLRIAHDVVKLGLSQGRIRAVAGNEVAVDEPVVMEAGKSYGMRVRKASVVETVLAIANDPGEHHTVTFTGTTPSVGDAFMFGLAGEETAVFRLLSIKPGKNFSAELQVVDDAPGITSADTGPIVDPGSAVVVDPPLALYRPRNLSLAQSIEQRDGINAQITKVYWTVRAGGPRMDRYLLVAQAAIDGVLTEHRATVAGDVFFAEFVNLETADWTFRAQGFTVDGRWTGFSDPITLDQILPEDVIGVGLGQLTQATRELLATIRADIDAAVEDAETLASELQAQANDLAAEAQARVAEDVALADELAAEAQARIAAVAANAAAVAAEAQARLASVQALADDLAAEAQARGEDVATLAAADAALAEDLAAEAQARGDAVADLAAEDAALAQEIATEAQARIADIAAETDARTQAVADQAAALTAEAAERLANIRVQALDLRALADRLLDIDALMAESATLGLDQIREVRTRIDVVRDGITAAYTDAITLATGPSSALAQRMTGLEAEIVEESSSRSAEVTRLDQAIVTGDAAAASSREVLATQIRGGYDGSDAALAGGMIGSLRSTFASQYEALTESLVSLQAGVDEQFDFQQLWLFDDDGEGWAGNGAPTWIPGGWLRPADHASDPYVASADGLGVSGDQYGQVRARIRRTGSPVWEGRLWWTLAEGAGWSAPQSVTIAEPTFADNGTAVVVWETDATGTIERLRLDLSAAQTASDYFEIDWIAIGRPSPGASIASQEALRQTVVNGLASEATAREQLATSLTGAADPDGLALGDLSSGLLYQERTARSSADAALSQSILGLEASLDDAETALSASATALQSLTTRVSTAEGTIDGQGAAIVANSEALTALEGEVAGKASSTALDQLSQEVATLGGDGLQSQASALRSVTARLLDLEMGLAEQEALGLVGDHATRQAVATAYEQLDAYTRLVEGRVETEAKRVDGLSLTLGGKADLSIVNATRAEVVAQGSLLQTQVAAVTSLQQAIGTKADLQAVTSLSQAVDQQGADIALVNSALTSLQGEVADKASGSVVAALSQAVEQQGEAIALVNSAVTSLEGEVDGKADGSVVDALSQTINQQGDAIGLVNSAVTSLQGEVDGKASGSVVTALSQAVDQQGEAIALVNSALTSLQGEVDGKADGSVVAALSQEVNQQGEAIDLVNSAVTSLQGELGGKADGSVVDALSQTVNQQGEAIALVNSAVTSLQGEVDGKASGSVVAALSQAVDQQGEDIALVNSALTSLQGEVDGKADGSVVDQLFQEVATLGGDGFASQAGALRSVTARLLDLEMGLAEQEALGLAGDQATRQAVATAYEQLDAYTRLVDGRVESEAKRVDGLSLTLGGKADVSVVNATRAEVVA